MQRFPKVLQKVRYEKRKVKAIHPGFTVKRRIDSQTPCLGINFTTSY